MLSLPSVANKSNLTTPKSGGGNNVCSTMLNSYRWSAKGSHMSTLSLRPAHFQVSIQVPVVVGGQQTATGVIPSLTSTVTGSTKVRDDLRNAALGYRTRSLLRVLLLAI